MKILFLNNDGAGFADYVEAEPGTTVGAFFTARCKGQAADYLIRVNRQPVPPDYVLQEGDRVSITPTKIEGANRPSYPHLHFGSRHENRKNSPEETPLNR